MSFRRPIAASVCIAATLMTAADTAVSAQHAKDLDGPTARDRGQQNRVASLGAPPQQGKPLKEIRLDPRTSAGPMPVDRAAALFTPRRAAAAGARHTPAQFHWKPSNLAFQPPYFDDVPLERYGQTVSAALQPVLSGAHFFGMFPIIPYKTGVDRTQDRVFTLGYHRVGANAPAVRQRVPLELDASLFESGAWVGLIFALP